TLAWDGGAYDAALADLRRVLTSRKAAEYEHRIAELTGETWQTVEVAKDARAPRWSPDGRGAARRVRLLHRRTRRGGGGRGARLLPRPERRDAALDDVRVEVQRALQRGGQERVVDHE